MGEAVEHFSYDGVGNRLTDDKTTSNWTYNKNNELQNFDNTSFKYNLNGQMTEKTVNGQKTTYNYNFDNRLSEIKDNSNQVIAQYEYDPFGRRLSKTLPKDGNKVIYFHYSDEGLIAEYNKSGSLIQSYGYKPIIQLNPDAIYAIDPLSLVGILPEVEPVFTHRLDFTEAKGYAYYINDHLGTPQKLITNTGRNVWGSSINAFGKTIVTHNEFRSPLRFPGQYADSESDLQYNLFRYYDTQLGRYLTSDPIGLYGGFNTYAYVEGNPVKYSDSLGLATSGQWKDCGGGCKIRIEDNHNGDGRHIHWECRGGPSGTCGENDTGSHGSSNCGGMTNRLKKCARKFGFNPDPAPDPQRNMCDECVGAAIWTFVVGVGWVLLNACGAVLGVTS